MYKLQSKRPSDLAVWETGQINIAPAAMVRKFGLPKSEDEYKVSGSYSFVDKAGNYFLVSDWKATNLYSDEYPSPDEFWASEELETFTISSAGVDEEMFEQWLRQVVATNAEPEALESSTSISNTDESALPNTTLLYLVQTGLGAVGLLIHIWTTWLAFNISGFWSAVLHFILFIYAECYWSYMMFVSSGVNVYSLVAGIWVIAYVSVLLVNYRLSKAAAREG